MDKLKAVKFVGYISRLSSRQDKSVSFGGATGREMSKDDFGYLRDLQGIELMVTLEPITGQGKSDYSEIHEIETGEALKSPSQRLRGILYRTLEQKLGREPSSSEFQKFYLDEYDRLCNFYKDKLD